MSFTKNNRTVFILGAGASYGDTLVDNDNLEETTRRIPLASQFFQSLYLDGEIDAIRRDYSDLLKYISANWNNNWPLGSERWDHLNLEDVFTSLAIENEFEPSDTDGKAQSQLLLNSLKRYIRKLIGKHSVNTYGKFSRQLVQNLKIQDSIITFNYDLLIDEAFIYPGIGPLHYERFYDKLFGGSFSGRSMRAQFEPHQGLFLKMHGSLNWFICTNNFCPNSDQPQVRRDIVQCLAESWHDAGVRCNYCDGLLTPYLVPPLLNKPILRDKISRNIWSNALSILQSASKIVIIGYSFPATDFYSQWLFRTALKRLKDVKVWVVNPLNDAHCEQPEPQEKANYGAARTAFQNRMANIITTMGDDTCKYYRFDQIGDILADVRS